MYNFYIKKMAEFVFIGLAVVGVSYVIKSTITSKKNLKKKKKYRDEVNKYTIKRGYQIQSNYENFESNKVILNSPRNPNNNEVYNSFKTILEQHDEHGNYIEILDDEYDLLELEPSV